MRRLLFLALLPLATASHGCFCSENEWTFHLSGTVSYAQYQQGPILVETWGDKYKSCNDTMQTPGKRTGETTLTAPGPFALDVLIQSNSASPPRILFAAYALGTGTDPTHCEAGATMSLAAADASGVDVVLQPGMCGAFQ